MDWIIRNGIVYSNQKMDKLDLLEEIFVFFTFLPVFRACFVPRTESLESQSRSQILDFDKIAWWQMLLDHGLSSLSRKTWRMVAEWQSGRVPVLDMIWIYTNALRKSCLECIIINMYLLLIKNNGGWEFITLRMKYNLWMIWVMIWVCPRFCKWALLAYKMATEFHE